MPKGLMNDVSVLTVGSMDTSRGIVRRLTAKERQWVVSIKLISGSKSLVVEHEALSVGLASNWIVDSGATCHV